MIHSLQSRMGTAVGRGKRSGLSKSGGTAKKGMTGGFLKQLKAYAKEDAKRGEYMSEGFCRLRLQQMHQSVSPDRAGPKAEVMSAIQAALKEPHPMMQAVEKMLKTLSGGGSASLKISAIHQSAEIKAPNGEPIASYSSLGGGWTERQTREEQKFLSEAAVAYLQAFREARAEQKAAEQSPPPQDGLPGVDLRA